jgi:O-antigen/teichoic acid export membrane protein
MIRRLIKDSAFYGLSSAIPAATGLLLLPFYARKLGPGEYGLLDATVVILTLISTIFALEIAQGVARLLPESDSTEARRRIGSTAFWFTALMLGFASLALAVLAPWIATTALGEASRAGVVRVAAATLFLGGLQGIAIRHLRWSLRARRYLSAVALTNLATAALGVVLVMQWKPVAEALLWGQAGGCAAGLIVSWLLAGGELAFAWDSAALRRMLRFSAPLVVSTLGVIATGQLGRVMLARLGSLDEAGVYGVAARLAAILALLASGLQLAIGPLIYSAHAKPGTPAELAGAFRIFISVTLIGWVALAVFAPEIVGLLTTPAFAASAGLIAPLGAAVVLNAALTFAPGLEIHNRTGSLAKLFLLSGAINLALCVILIPRLGAQGAALAALASSLVQAALAFYRSNRCYPVPYPWTAVSTAVAFALLYCGSISMFQPCLFLKTILVALSACLIVWLLLRSLNLNAKSD